MKATTLLEDKKVQAGIALTCAGLIFFLIYRYRKNIASMTDSAVDMIKATVTNVKGYSKPFINYLGKVGQLLTAPRGIKNNNPGNINKTFKSNAPYLWNGEVPHDENTDSRFKQFYDFTYGVRALMLNLKSYFKNGKDTVREIISTWAPASENKEGTEAYIKFVSKELKVNDSTKLAMTEKTLTALAKAIAKFENGVGTDWVDDSVAKKAYSLIA